MWIHNSCHPRSFPVSVGITPWPKAEGVLCENHSVWPPIHALEQALTATCHASKLPFPCCGVGFKWGMSRLSGPKVGSQHTPCAGTCALHVLGHVSMEGSHAECQWLTVQCDLLSPACSSWPVWSNSQDESCSALWRTRPERGLSLQLLWTDRLPRAWE